MGQEVGQSGSPGSGQPPVTRSYPVDAVGPLQLGTESRVMEEDAGRGSHTTWQEPPGARPSGSCPTGDFQVIGSSPGAEPEKKSRMNFLMPL